MTRYYLTTCVFVLTEWPVLRPALYWLLDWYIHQWLDGRLCKGKWMFDYHMDQKNMGGLW